MTWQKTLREEQPHEGHHPDHGYASASPVTDGEHVYAYFGSRGLHCLDFAGNVRWSKDFGRMRTRNSFGEGASPALHGGTIVVCWDDEGDKDFITALDKLTGKELWRTPRSEATGWSTPLVVEHRGRGQVIVSATGKVRSYELQTGAEIWSCAGQTANAIPTPVVSADTVFVTSGFRGNALYAIALGRNGDLTGSNAVRWKREKNTPYVPSPLLVDSLIYTVTSNNGVLSCFDTADGRPHFEGERLEGIGGIYASPVSAKDRVYILGRDGTCLVIRKGPRLEILARNKLNDRTDASIALAGSDLFIRGHQNLYCISGVL
jgi:outer membrane protein assembly factor BamB